MMMREKTKPPDRISTPHAGARRILLSSCALSLPAEFLILQPMRNDAVLAQAAHLVGFVVLEVALEPLHVAVALEGEHVGGDAVEEPAVMADDNGAAGE